MAAETLKSMLAREAHRIENKIRYRKQVIKQYTAELVELEERFEALLDQITNGDEA